jgi:hypothetical protein
MFGSRLPEHSRSCARRPQGGDDDVSPENAWP